jgi:hypothetical protein
MGGGERPAIDGFLGSRLLDLVRNKRLGPCDALLVSLFEGEARLRGEIGCLGGGDTPLAGCPADPRDSASPHSARPWKTLIRTLWSGAIDLVKLTGQCGDGVVDQRRAAPLV